MADFSKQYCEINDPEFPWDFDIEEISRDLKPGYYVNYICEGFGFTSIGKDTDGNIILYFPDEDLEEGHWKDYNDFIQSKI